MSQKIDSNTNVSLAGQLIMGVFFFAGCALILFGLVKLFSGEADGFSQFILSLLVGAVFILVSFLTARSQCQQKKLIALLNQRGVWLKVKAVDLRVVTTDSVGQPLSYIIIVEAGKEDQNRYNLLASYESEQIYCRSIPSNYQEVEFEMVIDPQSAQDKYFVNIDHAKLLEATKP